MKIKQLLTASFLFLTFCRETHGMNYYDKTTPNYRLQSAILHRNEDMVKFLLDANVNPNIELDFDGNTALMLVMGTFTRSTLENIVKLLLTANANPNITNKYGKTALQDAALNGQENIVKLLLNAKANPDIQVDPTGDTALMLAVWLERENIVQLLLAANADLSIIDKKGKTALDMAREKGFHKIEKILKDEQEKRRLLVTKKVTESISLIPELAEIVSEYAVCPKETKINL